MSASSDGVSAVDVSTKEVTRLGLVGCGAISGKHLDAIANMQNARLVAVADSDEMRGQEVAKSADADFYKSYPAMLEHSELDGVIIATPSGLHAGMAIEAIDAGKHVLVEKPMAMTLEDADLMINRADAGGRVLAVVHHNRFSQASRLLSKVIEDGRLGKLLWGSTSVRWYRPQDYYSKSGWRGTVTMDGGVLFNQAIHHIDLLLWYMGEVDAFCGFRGTLGHRIEAEDTAILSLRFKSGALGSIDATTCAYPKNLEETVTIIGERGSVVMGGFSLNSFREWAVDGCNHLEPIEERPKWYGHYLAIQDFVNAIRSGRKPAVDGREGRRVLELITKIYLDIPIKSRAEENA